MNQGMPVGRWSIIDASESVSQETQPLQFFNQITATDTEGFRYPQQRVEADPLFPTFNFPYVNRMQASFFRQCFLAQASKLTLVSDGITQDFQLSLTWHNLPRKHEDDAPRTPNMGLFLSCAILRKLIKPRGDLASKSETWEIMSGKKRILVIEDEMPVALMMVFLLSRVGYDVTTAHNGKKGIELASATRFDVITLDMDLPDIHGFEICHELKQRHVSRNTPIIFITGRHLKKIGSTPLNLARWITSRNHLKRVNSFFASPPKSETGSKM